MSNEWTVTRKGVTLSIRKNGEAYSTTAYQEETKVYDRLSNKENPFEYWVVMAKYYEEGAPTTWTTTVSNEVPQE